MSTDLVRFGVAMERRLLQQLDVLVRLRGAPRSEVLRDLVRAEVGRAQVTQKVPAVGTLTLVYDHHVRELTERLTEAQHELGASVVSTLHVHLDHDHCLEVIVLRGRADELQRVADRLIATRGVKHGGLQLVAKPEEHGHRPVRPRRTGGGRRSASESGTVGTSPPVAAKRGKGASR